MSQYRFLISCVVAVIILVFLPEGDALPYGRATAPKPLARAECGRDVRPPSLKTPKSVAGVTLGQKNLC
jgi:hypothetical protein